MRYVCIKYLLEWAKGLPLWLSGKKTHLPIASVPGWRRSPGGEGNPLRYFYLRNLMDRGAWWAKVHGVEESDMTQRLNNNINIASDTQWFSSVQSLSRVLLFAAPWTAAYQASLSITNSWTLLKLMSIKLVMPTNHHILCYLLLLQHSIFPSIGVFFNESVIHIRWPSIGVSASASVLSMNIQNWFPLGLTGWITLQSKGLSKIFSNTTVQKHQFFGAQPSL